MRYAEIEPDIVVATDGNFWSRLHSTSRVKRFLCAPSPPSLCVIYRGSSLMLLDQDRSPSPSFCLPGPRSRFRPRTVSARRFNWLQVDASSIVVAVRPRLLRRSRHALPRIRCFYLLRLARHPSRRGLARSIEYCSSYAKWPWHIAESYRLPSALASIQGTRGKVFDWVLRPPLTGFAISSDGLRTLAGEGPIRLGLLLAEFPSSAAERKQYGRRLASWRELAARQR